MRTWEKNIRKVTPYVPGEQPRRDNIIKLNTNENPYPPSPEVRQAVKSMSTRAMRLYPDPASSDLVEALAHHYHLSSGQIFVGVGSDDVLAMAFMTFFNSDKPLMFPDVTYSFYPVWAELFQIPYEMVPLDDQFHLVKEDYVRENGGIIFPNPNAPTGVYEPLQDVRWILQHNRDSVVIVDEAYIDFGGKSAVKLIDEFENLLVVQTFSKSRSLAGMRIGYAMGNPRLIRYLNDVKYSFNSYTMSRAAIILGVEAVNDEAYFRETLDQIITTRERVKEEMMELGFEFPDSRANFLFATHPDYPARELQAALKEEGIYVRYFDAPRTDNYLRITIGTDEEMNVFLGFLRKYRKK